MNNLDLQEAADKLVTCCKELRQIVLKSKTQFSTYKTKSYFCPKRKDAEIKQFTDTLKQVSSLEVCVVHKNRNIGHRMYGSGLD